MKGTRPTGHFIKKESLWKKTGIEKCAPTLKIRIKHTVLEIQKNKYFSLTLKKKKNEILLTQNSQGSLSSLPFMTRVKGKNGYKIINYTTFTH